MELTWRAPAGCSSAEHVQTRIRELLGAARVTGTQLRAEATVTRIAPDRLSLTLIVREGDLVGERHIEGSACEDLAAATAINLVLQLQSASQPSAAERGSKSSARAPRSRRAEAESRPSESPEQPEPEPPASPPPAQTDVPSESPPAPSQATQQEASAPPVHDEPSERSWRGLLQLPLIAAEFGPLPKPSFGLALAAGVQIDRWRVLLEGGAWLRQSLPASEPATVGAHADRVQGGLRVCRSFQFERFELAPCASASLEHLWARGSGLRVAARTAESTWIAGGIGVHARFALTAWLGLVAGADARLEAAHPQISVGGFGRVGQLGPVALRLNFGAEWIL